MLDFILAKKKKLLYLILLTFMVAISLNGCNRLNGKEPYNYPNTLWVCEEPFITLKVDSTPVIKAWLGDELSSQEFVLAFGYGGDVTAHESDTQTLSDETILFQGNYKSYEDHLIIYITYDNLWGGQYRELYFNRAR